MIKYSKENKFMIMSFIISLVVIFYRRPDSFYNSNFWGEEGTIFFAEAYHFGFNSLFNTCAGYFHLFPRLIANLAISFNIQLYVIPFIFCFSWLFIFFCLLFYIWKRLPFNVFQRFFISIAIILIPLQSEIVMNLTNIQWIMALFPLIIFSSTNISQNSKWFFIDLIIIVITGLTGPNYTVLLPLFISLMFLQKEYLRQDKRRIVLYVISILFGILGVISLIKHGSVNRVDGEFILFNKGFIQYVFVQYAFLFIGKFAFKIPILIMLIAVCGIVISMFFYLKRSIRTTGNNFLFISLVSGVLFLFTTMIAYRNEPSLLSPYYRGVRNFYLPAITFVWAIIIVISEYKFGSVVLSCLMILFAIQIIIFVGRFNFECYDMKKYSELIKSRDTLSIPINPAGWYIHIDNHKLLKNE